MSEYLDLPLRSLRDLYDETAAAIATLETERSHADDVRCDAIDAELAPLIDRLDALEEELSWRCYREERRNSPITL